MHFTKRLLFVALIAYGFSTVGFAEGKDVEETYKKSCAACHASGVANAPKNGDAAAWKPRLEKGMDNAVASVVNGLNAMPPKGMCMDCSDEDYAALIKYMATPK